MALLKKIELNNGVSLNYHRISCLANVINKITIIEVTSYTSASKRGEEEAATKSGAPMDVFMNTGYYNLPYDDTMSVSKAYDYLKTTDIYKGSEDV